ncbi:MAG: hypothetical protein LPK45_00485, partial [Bacteroidota bacterium]|nr:hypothetical protein [Bacteroidota bacterium]MDX5429503.1 hypothetical protein [Bacteroidota bacterium]MDX5468288.1 hypothetical protein [Bacteroidota bacterium]
MPFNLSAAQDHWDREEVNERQLDSVLLQKRLSESAFKYETHSVPTKSWFDKLIEWILRSIFEDAESEELINLRNIIYWALALFAIGLIAYYLAKMQKNRFFKTKNLENPETVSFLNYEGTKSDLEK